MQSETIFEAGDRPLDIMVLVLGESSIMCVASVIDPLRAANRVLGRSHFNWRIVSSDGHAPETTAGLPVAVSGRFDPARKADVLVVIGGFGTRLAATSRLIAGISHMARQASAVGGIEAGTWLLGHAGLLEARSATTHWEDLEDFAAAFPGCDVRPDRYVIDGPVFTAGGAAPAFDLMLHLIRSRLGMAVALDVASVFVYDQTRAASDAQPLVSLGRLEGFDPRLAAAIRLMEGHLEAPLPVSAIAMRAGVSARTLETIFNRAIGETPGAYYLRLRLNAARRLVLDSSDSMAEIAARNGFSSPAAFSRAFARAFGQPPTHMRRG